MFVVDVGVSGGFADHWNVFGELFAGIIVGDEKLLTKSAQFIVLIEIGEFPFELFAGH